MLEETLIKWRDQIVRDARLEDRRDVLVELMTLRFGPLPASVQQQLDDITSLAELRRLTRRVLTAKSLKEMQLGRARREPTAVRPPATNPR